MVGRDDHEEMSRIGDIRMHTQTMPLTSAEAISIAQRAFIEQITGQPGIWSHLNKRIRAERQTPKLEKRRLVDRQASPEFIHTA